MTFLRTAAFLTTVAALSGCQITQDGATNSGFRTPNANGTITSGVDNDGQRKSGGLLDSKGNGFAIVSGFNDEGLVAYTGDIIGDGFGDARTSGTATFEGRYQTARIYSINLNESSGFLTGQSTITGGAITLTADFGARTLKGTSDNRNLSVDGTLESGTALAGSVTYRDLDGALRGNVGSENTVGVFHGNDEDNIFAGGFIAEAR